MFDFPQYAVQRDTFSLDHAIVGDIFIPSNYEQDRLTIVFYHGWFSSVARQTFKASILASCGYRVIVPELIGHGVRGKYSDAGIKGMLQYFWPTVEKSIKEFSQIQSLCENDKKICVMGHSMGGFITAGLLAQYDKVAAGVSFNGCAHWAIAQQEIYDTFLGSGGSKEEFYDLGVSFLKDPADRVAEWMHKPYLMTNGKLDRTVSSQGNKKLIQMVKQIDENAPMEHHMMSETGHLITEEMLHLSIKFLQTHLSK